MARSAEKRKEEFDLVREQGERRRKRAIRSESVGHALARVSLSERLGMVFGLVGFGEMETLGCDYTGDAIGLGSGMDRLGRWTGGVHLRERERERYEESLQSTLAVRSARCTCTWKRRFSYAAAQRCSLCVSGRTFANYYESRRQ